MDALENMGVTLIGPRMKMLHFIQRLENKASVHGKEENMEHKQGDDESIRRWMEETVKLPQYADVLLNDGYDDFEMVADLTTEYLIQIGVDKSGHRKKILKHAKQLKHPSMCLQ